MEGHVRGRWGWPPAPSLGVHVHLGGPATSSRQPSGQIFQAGSTFWTEAAPLTLPPWSPAQTCTVLAAEQEPQGTLRLCPTRPRPVLPSGSVCPQRRRLSHPSLASQQPIAAQRSLAGLQEGPPGVVPGTPSWKLPQVALRPQLPLREGRRKTGCRALLCPMSRQLQ